MFWKRKKQAEKDLKNLVNSEHKKDIQAFKDFRDIGDRFTYLGIDMIVTDYYLKFSDVRLRVATLQADYVNKEGSIANIFFSIHELPGLIKENKEG